MIKGLTRAGLGEIGAIGEFVRKAEEYGFGAVDASGSELREWVNESGLEAVLKQLKSSHVKIGSIGLPVEWRAGEDQFRQDLIQLALDANIAEKLGVTACTTYILPSTDDKAAHFMAIATRRLRICAEILGGYGIRLGLEFVGPHHLRTQWANPFIWTLQETLDWIDAIGKPNVGLLLDSIHWYTSEMDVEAILNLNPEQIVHVHINDAKSGPVSGVLDNDRLYPGEGVIDLAAFLGALHTIGYKGVVAQEILTQQPPNEWSNDLLMRSKEGFLKVYSSAGLE